MLFETKKQRASSSTRAWHDLKQGKELSFSAMAHNRFHLTAQFRGTVKIADDERCGCESVPCCFIVIVQSSIDLSGWLKPEVASGVEVVFEDVAHKKS